MTESRARKGIISYLTEKHGGNVHDKGIVKITSASMWNGVAKCVADLEADSSFRSPTKPGSQWICWDFCDLRVRLTGYAISAYSLRGWVLEASMEGDTWTEVHRETNNPWGDHRQTLRIVGDSAPYRFIRLTQTEAYFVGHQPLNLTTVEFFGILYE
jgi:hypothetical protein